MSIWKISVLVVVVLVLGAGMWQLVQDNRELSSEVRGLSSDLEEVERENKELATQIDYYQEPENILKEIKSQFNYREQGEEMLIIVP